VALNFDSLPAQIVRDFESARQNFEVVERNFTKIKGIFNAAAGHGLDGGGDVPLDVDETELDGTLIPGVVMSTVENPKIIYGVIATATPGTIVSGLGFTIAFNGTGDITITFTDDFGSDPTVTCTPLLSAVPCGIQLQGNPTTTSARVNVIRADTGVAVNSTFHFHAIGPR